MKRYMSTIKERGSMALIRGGLGAQLQMCKSPDADKRAHSAAVALKAMTTACLRTRRKPNGRWYLISVEQTASA